MTLLTDLDHTLADASWRDDHRGNWDEYYAMSANDKAVTQMVQLLAALRLRTKIICVSARPEKWRTLTTYWLLKYNILVDELLMRPDNDYRKSPELKLALSEPYWKSDPNAVIAIDDREDVLAAYGSVGIKLLLRKI
jgi:hypothetical protein